MSCQNASTSRSYVVLGIEHYLHRLEVPREPGGYLLVSRVRRVAAGVAHGDGHDAIDLVEGALHRPEAAAREGRGVERRGGGEGESEQQVHGVKLEERVARGKRPLAFLELSHRAHTPESSCSAVSPGVASSRWPPPLNLLSVSSRSLLSPASFDGLTIS